MTILSDYNFQLRVARGLVSGHSWLRKFGRNSDIDTGGVPESLWNGGGVYTGFSAAAQTMKVLGGNAADDIGGTGAQKVTIFGLNGSGVEISEEISLAGVSDSLATSLTFLRVNKVKVTQVGSGGKNVGTITVQQTTSGNIHAVMPVGKNRTHIACWTVPAGKTLYLKSLFLSATAGASTNIQPDLFVDFGGGGIFESVKPLDVDEDGGLFPLDFDWLPIEENSDIDFQCVDTSQNNTAVSGGFHGILIDN